LKTKFADQRPSEQAKALEVLLQMGEDDTELKTQCLSNWKEEFDEEVERLRLLASESKKDILELVDTEVCNFLTNLSLAISSSQQLLSQSQHATMNGLAHGYITTVISVLQSRFECDKNDGECAVYVRALDKLVGKISTFNRLSPILNFSSSIASLVMAAAVHQVKHSRCLLKYYFIIFFPY